MPGESNAKKREKEPAQARLLKSPRLKTLRLEKSSGGARDTLSPLDTVCSGMEVDMISDMVVPVKASQDVSSPWWSGRGSRKLL